MDEGVVTGDARRARALDRYKEWTDFPLMVLAIAVIPLVLVEIFVDVEPRAERSLEITYALIWAAFLVDYVVRLVLAPDRGKYVREEWLALVIVVLTVPLPWVPDALGFLRASRTLRLFRLVRFGAIATRGAQQVVKPPRTINSQLTVGVSVFVLVTIVSSVLVLAVEEGRRGSQINSMGDSLWFAVSTVSTVGFGDLVPETTLGRIIALLPMIAGVCFIGVIAANFGSRLFEAVEERFGHRRVDAEKEMLLRIEQHLLELNERLARVETSVQQ